MLSNQQNIDLRFQRWVISTYAQKSQHPVASKIPDSVWRKYFWECEETKTGIYIDVQCMRDVNCQVSNVKLDDLPADKYRAFFWLLICCPSAKEEEYVSFARDIIKLSDKDIFLCSLAMGRLSLARYLKKMDPNKVIEIIKGWSNDLLEAATTSGDLDTLKWLIDELPLPAKRQVSKNRIINYFIRDDVYVSVDEMESNNSHLHGLGMLFAEIGLPPQDASEDPANRVKNKNELLQFFIRNHHCELIMVAAFNGHIDILEYFRKQDPYSFQILLNDNLGLEWLIKSLFKLGKLEVLQWFDKHFKEHLVNICNAQAAKLFAYAVKRDDTELIEWLRGKLSQETFLQLIRANKYHAFKSAGLKVLQWHKEQITPDEFQRMAANSKSFVNAGIKGDISALNWHMQHTYHLASPSIQNLDRIFDIAITHCNLNMLHWLDEKFPEEILIFICENDFELVRRTEKLSGYLPTNPKDYTHVAFAENYEAVNKTNVTKKRAVFSWLNNKLKKTNGDEQSAWRGKLIEIKEILIQNKEGQARKRRFKLNTISVAKKQSCFDPALTAIDALLSEGVVLSCNVAHVLELVKAGQQMNMKFVSESFFPSQLGFTHSSLQNIYQLLHELYLEVAEVESKQFSLKRK